MPFMIVGSFLLVFAYPPFSPDTTWGLRAWLDLAKEFEGRILTPFDMTMGIMSIYICAAISYNLGKHYEKTNQLDPFMCACCRSWLFCWWRRQKRTAPCR
jgi:PTS system cellobiose-specific IIC component